MQAKETEAERSAACDDNENGLSAATLARALTALERIAAGIERVAEACTRVSTAASALVRPRSVAREDLDASSVQGDLPVADVDRALARKLARRLGLHVVEPKAPR